MQVPPNFVVLFAVLLDLCYIWLEDHREKVPKSNFSQGTLRRNCETRGTRKVGLTSLAHQGALYTYLSVICHHIFTQRCFDISFTWWNFLNSTGAWDSKPLDQKRPRPDMQFSALGYNAVSVNLCSCYSFLASWFWLEGTCADKQPIRPKIIPFRI